MEQNPDWKLAQHIYHIKHYAEQAEKALEAKAYHETRKIIEVAQHYANEALIEAHKTEWKNKKGAK